MAVRTAIAWSVGGQAAAYLILFVGSVLVARLLTPHDMGVFAVGIATVGILNTFAGFNVGTYVIRAPELHRSLLDTAFTVNALLSCAVALAIYFMSAVERRYLSNPDIADVLIPLAFSAVAGIFEFRPAVMLQRELRFKTTALIQVARAILSNGITVGLALHGFGFMSLPYGNVAGALMGAIACNALVPEHTSLRVSLSHGRAMASFGIQMMSIGGIGMLAKRCSEILLGHTLGLSALGLYSRASSIAALVFDNTYSAVTRVLFVRLSEEARSSGSVRDIFLRSFDMITALLWPIQLGVAILAGPAIYYLYGARWVAAALPLSILMVAQCVTLCFGMNWELFVIKGETGRQTRFEFIIAAAGMIIFAIGCLFNLVATASARFLEAALGFAIYHPHMSRLSQARPGEISRILIKNLSLALVAILPSFVLMIEEGWSNDVPIVFLLGAIGSGIGAWLWLLARTSHPLFDEIRKAANWRLASKKI
jgi:O-antigen/teichoic acid export membrane protein